MYYIQKGSRFLYKRDITLYGLPTRLVEFNTRNEAQSFIETHKSGLDGSQVLTIEQAFEELIR